MEINNHNINAIGVPKSKKKVVSKQKEAPEQTKDYLNSPNPAEYIGRSQVTFASKKNTTELKPLKLKANKNASKDELKEVLKKFSFTDEEIEKIDFENEKILEGITGLGKFLEIKELKKYTEEIKESFKEGTPEEREKFLKEELPEIEFKYVNNENFETLKKYIDFEDEEFFEIINELSELDSRETIFAKLPYMVEAKGKINIRDIKYSDASNFEGITPERVQIIKQINEVLPEKTKLSAIQCSNLGNDEDLTAENVEKYIGFLKKYSADATFATESLLPTYESKSLKELTTEISAIDDVLKEYPIDFSNNKERQYSINELKKITSRKDLAEVQAYINSLSTEARATGIEQLPNENSALDKSKLATICNTVHDENYGEFNIKLFDFIKNQEENNYENLDGIIKLIKAYQGTGELNTSYLEKKLCPAHNDFDGAIETIDLKKEIRAKDIELPEYYINEAFNNPDIDYSELNKQLRYIRDNNLDISRYPLAYLQDPKGYNKLFLDHKTGRNHDWDTRMKIAHFSTTLESQEELDFAADLFQQRRIPDDKYSSRFHADINTISSLVESYREDKESTKAILDLKDERGYTLFDKIESIKPAIDAYRLDRETTLEFLNLKNHYGHLRVYSGEKLKSLVETAQIDKEYTFEVFNKEKNYKNERKEYRFDEKQVRNIVEAGQIDKEFTNTLLDLEATNSYGQNYFRIYDTENYKFFAEKHQKYKELTELLLLTKEKSFDNIDFKYSERTAKAVLNNPPENHEYLLSKMNEQDTSYSTPSPKYNNYDIENLANATMIDKDLTDRLLNETYKNYNFEYKRFGRTEDVLKVVKASAINKEFTLDLLSRTEKRYFNEDLSPKYGAEDIETLLDLCETYGKEKVEYYLSMEKTYSSGDVDTRFSPSEIKTILNVEKTNPDLVSRVINATYETKNGKIVPLYTANELYYINKADTKNHEFTQYLLDRNEKNQDLHGEDFEELVDASLIDKEFTIQLLEQRGDDEYKDYRFDSYDIRTLVTNCKDDKELVLKYAKMTKTNERTGETECRFKATDIQNLILAHKKDSEFIEELLNIKYKTENNQEIYRYKSEDILRITENLTFDDYKKLKSKIGDTIKQCNAPDLITAVQFQDLYQVKSVNEVSIELKKNILERLISSNANLFNLSEALKEHFPLLPTNTEEYCELLPSLVHSIGIETNELSDKEITKFNKDITSLSNSLAELSDDKFANLEITQEYSKNDFIKDVLELMNNADLSTKEKQRVFDYFGFELHKNEKCNNEKFPDNSTGYSIIGYPVNLNNGVKLAEITDEKTKEVVEKLRKNVIRFSENNKISTNNKEIENYLNNIMEVLPELHPLINKAQHKTHDFDILKHSLKVMQKVTQNPEFETLSDSDKKIMLIATLMHDITKAEGYADKTHPHQSAFDTYYITKKFKLSQEEEIKLHRLISSHEWLGYTNADDIDDKERKKRMQSVAFDLQQGNLFDMASIFTKADLEAIQKEPSERIRGWMDSMDVYSPQIRENIDYLKKTQPLLPTTKMPKASVIEKAITHVHDDGSTNIKGVYKDKDGLVVVKFNEVEDWEAIGLPKGTTNRGIKVETKDRINGEEVTGETETGNIKFFVHGLDYANQLAKFEAFAIPNSNALLSVSYAERPETKYRFFRAQGVMLDVPADYVYGGGDTDSGSGCGKDIDNFKDNYVFGGYRETDRNYVSELIKEETGMNDEEYKNFVMVNKDKPMTEIEPKELQEKLIKKLATINSKHRRGDRAYNEMYISNPRSIMGVFAYDMNKDCIDEPLKFLEDNNARTDFLKKYALEHDVPFYLFGD